jgi:uncharacterized protein (TIGR03435 family)
MDSSGWHSDAFKPMLRTLLMEKFKLAVHYEDRPVGAYVLTAPKPKLQKADPAMSRLAYCQNMGMADFPPLLPGIASGYVRTLVVDEAGLSGSYDFLLSFSPVNRTNDGGGRGEDTTAGGAGSAADPTGGMSLFDAISKQLGLKLEPQKRPATVLVIDHAEQKPIDN